MMIRELFDLIAPRSCVMCGKRLEIDEEYICQGCNDELPRTHFQQNPYENMMAQLFWGLMPIERAAAWFYYAPNTKTSQIIYDLKYHDQPDIGIVMGQAAAREFAADNFFEGIDVILPVPLAKERWRQRGYNQSEMIARGISQETGITVLTDAVMRLHFSESQTHLDRWERLKNVEQQFQAPNPASLSGKHVLLVDDVTTSGATIIACASALHPKQHQIRFSVLTLGFTHS